MADKKIGEYYAPPVKMGKWEGFKKFLWNSETSQCLGRTGSSWGKYIESLHLYLILCLITTIYWVDFGMSSPKYTLLHKIKNY